MKYFLILLLFFASSIFAANTIDIEPFIDPTEELPKVEIQNKPVYVPTPAEMDSIRIYKKLIAQERDQANYGPYIIGISISALAIAGGTCFLIPGIKILNHENADLFYNKLAGGMFIFFSTPFYLAGIPLLVYNTYALVKHKKHHNKMIEYQKQFDDYKARI